MKNRHAVKVSVKWIPIFSIAFFFIGMLFSNRWWSPTESGSQLIAQHRRDQELQVVSEDCNSNKKVSVDSKANLFSAPYQKQGQDKDVMQEVYKTHEAIQSA